MFCRLALILCLLCGAGSLRAVNLLDDPGFESATGGGQTSNSNWSLAVNFPDTLGASAQFQTASFAANSGLTGVWFKSFEGDPAGTLANATLSQTVAGGAGTYDLSFFAKRESGFDANAMFVRLSTDMGDMETFNLLSLLVPNDGSWNAYNIFDFVASAGTTMLTVDAIMEGGFNSLANPQSFLMDDFNLDDRAATVPEPATILLTGIGALWLFRRRRSL